MDSAVTSTTTAQQFVHLHVHTQYSLLHGAIRPEALVEKVKALGMPAVAMTDTHNLFGAIDFYFECKDAGIKPIIGVQVFYAPEGRVSGYKTHNLILLCKNIQGYQNLCQLLTKSYLDSANNGKSLPALAAKAIIDRKILDQWGDDLVVIVGDLKSELAYHILQGEEKKAEEVLLWFKERFKDDFYLELQDRSLSEQELVNSTLAKLGEKHGVKCVATSPAYYLDPEDAEAHEILQCIEHGYNLDFDRPKSLVPNEYYFKPASVLAERFEAYPQALVNTLEVAEKCDLKFKFKDEKGRQIYHLPNFRPEHLKPDEPFDLITHFREEAQKGLEERYLTPAFRTLTSSPDWPENKKVYEARLQEELDMIVKTGFSGYFLIVADFINWAKKQGIPVGPGRGSGAGSLVAYSLKITDIDPIPFKLLFERFINPERISMPDFDIDFCQDRRSEVIEYVERRYGKENVSQIITYGKLQARAVIKDVGRVLGLSFSDTDQITKLLLDALNTTIEQSIEGSQALRERIEKDPKVAKIIEYARKLEGLFRNAGIHAAGVIITEKPIVTYCPLYVGKDGDVVTQFDKDFAEKIGLIKFDFLGLKTLTVVDNAVKLIRENADPGTAEVDFQIEAIPYNDPAVYALISSGDTDGIFQVESSGMKDLCSRLQPNSLEDITAINALYRPGPLGSGMVDDFIDRKHGRLEVKYDVPQLEPILRDTYGVIVYQEQVMQMARDLAGYSLGQADLLRRAMGKKKAEEMAAHKEIFVKGAIERGIAKDKAESTFDLMAKFADYGFNKSHSAAYGAITYQTAYLKCHYPAEFMAALMTTEMDTTEKITRYISDARSHGIEVLPPDVNVSVQKFRVEKLPSGKKGIRFGLEAIKGVGGIAVDALIEARKEKPFANAMDFCKRVSTRKANKKVLEALTLAGAFDAIAEVNRATLFASLETLLEHAGDEQAERELGQVSLFDSFSADELKLVTPVAQIFKEQPDWPQSKKLMMEKQIVGFYVSGHPMDPWQKICDDWLGWNTERLKQFAQDKAAQKKAAPAPQDMGGFGGGGGGRYSRPQRPEAKLAGLITESKEIMTKKGDRMAFVTLEDLYGKIELIFFPEAFARNQEILKATTQEAEAVLVGGELDITDEGVKMLVRSVEWVRDVHTTRVQQVVLNIKPSETTPDQMRELKKSLLGSRGKCPVRIEFQDAKFRTRLDLPGVSVAATPQLVQSVNRIFGKEVVVLR